MTRNLQDTEFWQLLMRDVYGPRDGGAIIVIDAENARKGVAKTSCMAALARAFAKQFEYELVADDGVLGGKSLLDRYREHPGMDNPSVIAWDEAVGAGSGDARRAMSNDNIELGRAWQLLRAKRIVTLTTLPDWNDIDVRLQKLADYRVHVSEWPLGEFKAYKAGTKFSNGKVVTYGLGPGDGAEPISFPNMDYHGDFFYEALAEKKDELIHSGTFEADKALADGGEMEKDPDTVRREAAVEAALRAVKPWDENRGMSQADAGDVVDYSAGWVSKRVREWRKGEFSSLDVPQPSKDD